MEIDNTEQDLQKAEDADAAYTGTFDLLAKGGKPQDDLKLTTSLSDDSKAMADAFNEKAPAEAAPVKQAEPVRLIEPAKADGPVKFGDAFRKARSDGLKVFDWNGKKYHTRLKGEADTTARPVARPMAATAQTVFAPMAPTMEAQMGAPSAINQPMERAYTPQIQNQAANIGAAPITAEKPSPSRRGLSERYIEDTQSAYDAWMAAKRENSTWWGGKAQPRPGMLEREQQAEKRYLELLRSPR